LLGLADGFLLGVKDGFQLEGFLLSLAAGFLLGVEDGLRLGLSDGRLLELAWQTGSCQVKQVASC
jgi:hypothetical protein